MKRFLPVFLLFFGLSIQSFASTSFGNSNRIISDTETLGVLLSNNLEAEFNKNEEKTIVLDEQNPALDSDVEKLRQCWIIPIICSCNTYTTQYCDDGFHGTPSEWANQICCQGCGDGCLSL